MGASNNAGVRLWVCTLLFPSGAADQDSRTFNNEIREKSLGNWFSPAAIALHKASGFLSDRSLATAPICGPYGDYADHESCQDTEFGTGNCVKDGLSLLHARFYAGGPDSDKASLVREIARANNNIYYKLWNSPYSSSWKRPFGSGWKELDKLGLYLFEDFLTTDEADQLASSFNAEKATPSGTFGTQSRTCNFRRSTTSRVSARKMPFDLHSKVALATGTDVHNFETTLLTRYGAGDFYSDHHDSGPCTHTSRNKDHPEVESLKLYVQSGILRPKSCDDKRRMGTVLIYLNGKDEYNGGATYFPNLNIRVNGKKGSAIFFHPTFPDMTTDPFMLHAAEMVKSGTKIVAQQWIEFPRW